MTKKDILVIVDGDCVLCSRYVHFLLAHERGDRMRFVAMQSEVGLHQARERGFTAEDLDRSILVVQGTQSFVKSEAVLFLLSHLKAPYRWLRILRFLPRPLRDWGYDRVARNRYQWFGRRQACLVMPPHQQHRFLQDKTAETRG
ncbi:MAG: DCC1-like thiol-disulfide oxidoreductase family protein [Pseudomonadota bacterium]